MTFWLSWKCRVTPDSAPAYMTDMGCTGAEPTLRQGTATHYSIWYRSDSPANPAELDIYDGTWFLLHNALFATAWHSYQQSVGTWPLHITTRFGNGTTPVNINVSLYDGTYDPALDPANPANETTTICAYGTQRQTGVTEAIQMSAGVVAGLGLGTGEIWTIPILAGLYGSTIVMDQICGSQKQPDQVVDLADWTTQSSSGIGTVAAQKVISNFRNKLWDAYCQCTPAPSGSPDPVSPPVTIMVKPTYLTTVDNVTIDNTEISTTINQLWQYFLSLNIGNQTTTNITSAIADCTCRDLKLGTAHEGLTGEGVITVSGIHGLSVTYTTLPDRIGVAIGDPDTIYTGAWINVGNAWGWQPRLFPNTTSWVTFPPDMHQMTQVGYSVPEDVVLTIAELEQA